MDIYWISATPGDFNTAANWNPNQVPGALDIAKMTVPGADIVAATSGTTVLGITVGSGAIFQDKALFTATEGYRNMRQSRQH